LVIQSKNFFAPNWVSVKTAIGRKRRAVVNAKAMFNLKITGGSEGRLKVDLGLSVTDAMLEAAMKKVGAAGVLRDQSLSTRNVIREALQAALDAE